MASVLNTPELLSLVLEHLVSDLDYKEWSCIDSVLRLTLVSRLWQNTIHSGRVAEALFLKPSRVCKIQRQAPAAVIEAFNDPKIRSYPYHEVINQVANPALKSIWGWTYYIERQTGSITVCGQTGGQQTDWMNWNFTRQQYGMQLGIPPITHLRMEMCFEEYFGPDDWEFQFAEDVALTDQNGITLGSFMS